MVVVILLVVLVLSSEVSRPRETMTFGGRGRRRWRQCTEVPPLSGGFF